jgi:hypothetical protein
MMSKYNSVFLDSQPFKMELISNAFEMPLSPPLGTDGIITVVPFETSVTDDGGGEFPKHLKAIPS